MTNSIVQVNVSTQFAPVPDTLQKSGALISQGGTTITPGTDVLLSSLADLTGILAAAKPLTSLVWSGSVVTATTTAAHGWTMSDVIPVVIAGATPSGYNGAVTATVTGASTFTYPLVSNPGSETIAGTVTLASESEVLAMGTTFFAQGTGQGVYLLELGEGGASEGVADLAAFIAANPETIYSYTVPRNWDNNSDFLALANTLTANDAKTYFFVTTTVANRAVYAGLKCILAQVEAPAIPATEFDMAADQFVTLKYTPNSTNRVTPLSYGYVFGVTPYPDKGNQSVFTELDTANVGWVGTGSEGGLSNKIIFRGQLSDGNPFNFWYSADWAQINIKQALANEVINGSNNSLAPLYYDQPGINRLQNRALKTLRSAITNGLAFGTIKATRLPTAVFAQNYEDGLYAGYLVINAEPFSAYTAENPNDYAAGLYGGMACVYTPSRGFKQIIFNLTVTNIITGA